MLCDPALRRVCPVLGRAERTITLFLSVRWAPNLSNWPGAARWASKKAVTSEEVTAFKAEQPSQATGTSAPAPWQTPWASVVGVPMSEAYQ